MRYHHLSFDVWLCLLISFLLSQIPVKIAERILSHTYTSYLEEHAVADGEVGGVAGEDVYRAEDVEDLLSHETFTVISPGIEYRNRGAGYYDGRYMYALTLPSGERVAARINGESVQHTGETIYDGETILPVGRLVYEDLSDSTSFLEQIEHSRPLDRTDFYVDMLGEGERMDQEDYIKTPLLLIRLLSLAILFPILHAVGARLGIFPYFFPPKKKEQS